MKALLKLQAVDLEARGVEIAAATYPARLSEIDQDLGAHRTASDQKQAELDEIDGQRRTIELQIQAQKDQIRKWESRLLDIKTPREYAAMSREIDIAKKSIKNQEEEILNLMEQAEALQKEIEVIERTIFEKEKGYESERAELRGKLAAVDEDRADIEARRANVSREVEPGLLSIYNRIKSRRAGIAMSAVQPNAACEACRMRIPPRVYNQLMTNGGEELVQCPSCHRILYVPESEDDDSAESGTARS